MYVTNSNISMSSARKYSEKTSLSVSVGYESTQALVSEFSKRSVLKSKSLAGRDRYQYDGKDKERESFEDTFSKRWSDRTSSVSGVESVDPPETFDQMIKFRIQCINFLLDILFGRKQYAHGGFGTSDRYGFMSGNAKVAGQDVNPTVMSFQHTEAEDTTFSTVGKVVTADGRTIDFNLELSMSRRFVEESSSMINFEQPALTDPLVINLDCAAADVSDQKFYFDLDGDGHDEYISKLSAGSGFLALDRNGNGSIDDGTELFGTKSGDGFYDLSQYDTDGNGWIDEADEIFDKLVIFSFDENGQKVLTGLGKAGVGAIYLGNTETGFSIKDSDNRTDAMIRSSGVFLYENGGVGTVQQVDIAG